MKTKMNAAEFQRAQATMGLIGRMAETIDWNAYAETVSYAETIGPIIDPTAWVHSPHGLREKTTELARLIGKIKAQWQECRAELDAALEREG